MPSVCTTWGCAAVALALGLGVASASAQQSGIYAGTTSQGQPIRLTVGTAPGGGLEVMVIEATYLLSCETSGQTVGLASAVFGAFPVDASGQVDASYLWDRDYFRTTGGFTGATQMAGDTTWSIAAVTPLGQHLAEVCAAPVSTWTATSTGGARLPGHAAQPQWRLEVHLARDGRVLSRQLRQLPTATAGAAP